MTSRLLFALTFAVFGLAGCSKPAAPFIKTGKKYTFYYENNRNWVRGTIVKRTHDGWCLIKYEGSTRWINAQAIPMVKEEN